MSCDSEHTCSVTIPTGNTYNLRLTCLVMGHMAKIRAKLCVSLLFIPINLLLTF